MADIPTKTTSRERTLPSIPSRPPLSRSKTNSHHNSDLQRVYSARHLDDGSIYHRNDEDRAGGTDSASASDTLSEKAKIPADSDLGSDEADEVRDGVLNENDLEKPLEKAETRKSIKDSNIVSSLVLLKQDVTLVLLFTRSHGKVLMILKTQRIGGEGGSGQQR